MEFDEIAALLPKYKMFNVIEDKRIYFDIGSPTGSRSHGKTFVTDHIIGFIDIHNTYSFIIEFLILNEFHKVHNYYYTKNVNGIVLSVIFRLYNYLFIYGTKRLDLNSDELNEKLREILNLESSNKVVVNGI